MAGFISRAKEIMRRKRAEQPVVFVLYFVLRAGACHAGSLGVFGSLRAHDAVRAYPGAIAGAVADRAYA